ncbi:hypothetical protein B0J15DRAFT_589461 [Fusarium solani]|uniref:Uncharacterized protein n=1 Tax=Fusarium solani TaxID=169388 RepID=A0A9P9RCY2_FUSSL|nr:uncharacterized protein B0J15DRAFT_589461 [Fusarium solani]KAH7274239.1 hypothetical protein B0J15DRAFT_589461 [Fusarium solani]
MVAESSSTSIDTLLASLQDPDTSAEGEARRDAFAQFVSEAFAKGNTMALPAGVPAHNGVNGTNGAEQVASPLAAPTAPSPPTLPNGHSASRRASSASASANSALVAPMERASQAGSPAQSSPLIQHKSPPIQQAALNQSSHQPSQTPNGFQHQPSQGPPQQIQIHGHASPQAQAQSTNVVQETNEYQQLLQLINNSPATAVRQAIRDKWDKALLGSQYHIAFLLNATMHQASPETLSRAVRGFGQNLVQTSKREIMEHLSPDDFDELVDLILPRVSNQFLDKALARRLETIPARHLVNALARAERLGYDVQDIVQEQNGEHVIPSLRSISLPPGSQPVPTMVVRQHQPTPPLPQQPPQVMQQTQAMVPMTVPQAIPHPPGVVYCQCGWPCTSKEALDYHLKKRACDKVRPEDQAGRDICLHCGCRFGSGGGLLYHEKSNVCGTYNSETGEQMRNLIAAFRQQSGSGQHTPAAPTPPPRVRNVVMSQPPSQSTPNVASRSNWTASPQPSQQPPSGTPGRDPYAHLTEQKRIEFETKMREAEERYGKMMRDAMELPEAERGIRLASLKNSYNTKMSTTRKKYGIRLRERRTKEQIAAEQARIMAPSSNSATPTRDSESRPNKRPRTDAEEPAATGGPNGQQESPRKRVPVSEMGGLSGSQATAELTDPTTHLNPTQPRYVPPKSLTGTGRPQSKMSETPDPARQGTSASLVGTQADPMSIDDDSDSDSDSDSDDDDIPATLP